jgi:hypothetical protein
MLCICVVAWAIWQYDHGVYAWRERLGKREKKIKSINKSREREKKREREREREDPK